MHRQDRNDDEEHFAPPEPRPPSSPPAQRQPPHETNKHEMAKAPINAAKEDEKEDISIRSVLEMGYSQSAVDFAVEQLRTQGKSNYSATKLMEIILDQEERQAATTKTASTSTSSSASRSQASQVSAESESLLKENETLRQQMLCKICLDQDASIVYLPCGHMVTCQDCAPTIRKCCICRKIIQGTLKAYL